MNKYFCIVAAWVAFCIGMAISHIGQSCDAPVGAVWGWDLPIGFIVFILSIAIPAFLAGKNYKK